VKKKRFPVEQIVAVLKQAEVGVPVVEVCRQVGIPEQTFYRARGLQNLRRLGPFVQPELARDLAHSDQRDHRVVVPVASDTFCQIL
jgi:hypothetical protein